MKRWAVFAAAVVLMLAYDKSAKSYAQSLEWLFPGGAALSTSHTETWPESKGHPKIASRLTQARGTTPLLAQPGLTPVPLAESLSGFARFDQQGRVEVYITLNDVNDGTLDALRAAGVEIEIYDASQRLVQGWVAPPQLQAVADLPDVKFVDLPNYGMTNAGSVMTQGDAVIRADQARALRGVTGSGVKVGVLSNGISGLTASVVSGDLPASGVTMPAAPLTGGGISLDSPLPGGATFTVTPIDRLDLTSGAEGTAMLEIIHDIAPDAQLFFAPGGTTLADQRAIRWLKSQGVQVITDDIAFFNTGPYDGTSAVSQEASSAVASGVSYFVAVGNHADKHYRGLFTDSDGDTFHEFDVSLGLSRADNAGETLNMTLQPGETIVVLLQWNDPFGASTNDYDLCLVLPADNPSTPIPVTGACSFNLQTGTQNPTEVAGVINVGTSSVTLGIAIRNFAGRAAPRVFDLFLTSKGSPMNEFVVPGGSVPNKSDAGGGVISVGAVNWQTPNVIEVFSSRGPTADGRLKPELVAPDGVATSVAGFSPFFGTSAAAPHAAGAAALVLSANPTFTPAQLSARLTQTAVPLDSPIPNNTFGFGRIDALQALFGPGPVAAVSLNGFAFGTGQTITYQATLTPGSTPTQVDIYFGVLMPDGVTFLSFVPGPGGSIAFAFGPVPVPFAANVTLSSTVVPFSYTFTGTEPVGTYFTYAGLTVAGSDPLQPANQLSVSVQAFQFSP